MAPDGDRPDWWAENERLRERQDLPPYEPPTFADGTYVHEVIDRLEAEHGVSLRLLGVNTRYPEDWELRIDGEPAFQVGRSRTDDGNTVYAVDAETFAARVADHLGPEE